MEQHTEETTSNHYCLQILLATNSLFQDARSGPGSTGVQPKPVTCSSELLPAPETAHGCNQSILYRDVAPSPPLHIPFTPETKGSSGLSACSCDRVYFRKFPSKGTRVRQLSVSYHRKLGGHEGEGNAGCEKKVG